MGFEDPVNYDAEYEVRGKLFYVHRIRYTLDFPGGCEVTLQEAGSIPNDAKLLP